VGNAEERDVVSYPCIYDAICVSYRKNTALIEATRNKHCHR